MSVYMLCIREGAIRDQAEMGIYQRMNRENPTEVRPTPLAIYGAIEALEGNAPDGIIILQFPTVEAAKAWYNSPQYQAAIPHRQKAADYRMLLVQGL